jgi:ATP-binding cassette subfamily C protein
VIGFLSKAQDGGAGITEYLAHPVALLPSSASYRMVDPTTGSVRAVNAEVAKELHEYAFMLYSTALNEVHVPQGLVAYLFRRHWRELGAIVAIAIAGGLVTMLIPIVTGIIYGRIIPNGYRSELSQLVAVLFAAALGACTFQVIRATSVLRLKIKLDLHLQPLVWGRLLALPVSFFRRFSVGDLADRIQGMGAIRQLLLADVTTTALALVTSVTSFGLLFYYSWRLGLLASGLLLSFTVVTFVLTLLQLRHRRVALELQGKLSTLAFAFVDGIAKLRSSGAEIRSYARWAGQYAEHARSGLRAQSIANLQAGLTTFYLLASELLLFAFVGFRLSSRLSVGSFLAFSAAFGQIQAALLTFSSVIPELVAILPLYRRLEPVLTESPEVADAKEEIELSGDVEVRNVSFRYQERGPSVLDRISLKVGKGEFVAIVGPSGSGKSTLIRLLLGFETPTSGSIAYDDRELASLDLKSVRRQIGTVLQNSKPIPGDILSNIIGGTNRDIGDAWNAARMAGIDQEIKAMPMGMQTLIGEGAKMFSGGERQRLMIARAVVNKPRIVLLDEATSALDNPAQEKIQLCLEQMKITRIVVAHRLSTVRRADRIYVFENGRIIDEGTYEDLSQKDGYFTKMMSRQVVG